MSLSPTLGDYYASISTSRWIRAVHLERWEDGRYLKVSAARSFRGIEEIAIFYQAQVDPDLGRLLNEDGHEGPYSHQFQWPVSEKDRGIFTMLDGSLTNYPWAAVSLRKIADIVWRTEGEALDEKVREVLELL